MSTVPTEVKVNGQQAAPPVYQAPVVSEGPAEKTLGWLTFAAIMLGLGGTLGLIDGIVAVSKSSFYVANAHYVFSDLNTWGWFMIIVGATALFAAAGVVAGSQWARWTGIAIASLQAIVQLMAVQAYPFWSLCVFAIDVLVIYALAQYGGRNPTPDV